MKLFAQKPDESAEIPPMRSAPPRYSQPLPEIARGDPGQQVVYAGFTRSGEVGYIIRERQQKPIHEEATPANRANERPRGFFQSLARLFFGGPR
jgi:hypothetical protein